MNKQWREFLVTAGARFEEDRVSDFGDTFAEIKKLEGPMPVLCDLSHYATIEVTGNDALEFLHNQTCNDALELGQGQLTAVCNPKGRILFSFRLTRLDDRYLIRLPAELADQALKRLGMFVLRSQVKMEILDDQSIAFGYAGKDADQRIESLLGIPSPQINQTVGKELLMVTRTPGEMPRFEILGPVEALKAAWATLATDARPCGADVWSLLDIRAGIPNVYAATQDTFIPQMLNYQAIDGLSFTKGCYPGQEVVARMHYLGKLKRTMVRGRLDAKIPVGAGDELAADDSDSGQWAGKIVAAVESSAGTYELLAVILNAAAETGKLSLLKAADSQLQLLPLPYEIGES